MSFFVVFSGDKVAILAGNFFHNPLTRVMNFFAVLKNILLYKCCNIKMFICIWFKRAAL